MAVFLLLCYAVFPAALVVFAQPRFENLAIGEITIDLGSDDANSLTTEQFRLMTADAVGKTYSTVRIRDAIDRLYRTKRIASVEVEAEPQANNAVNLRFIIARRPQAQTVNIEILGAEKASVTEQELLLRLNLLQPGAMITEQLLEQNADVILDYLRDRGFFRAEVSYVQTPITKLSQNEVAVTFRVTPNEQARVGKFDIKIPGFDSAKFEKDLKLKTTAPFSRLSLTEDIERVRAVLRRENYLAPVLNEPRPVFDSEKNEINIELTGAVGPLVEVSVDSADEKIGKNTQLSLLPIKREGTLDFAAIEEGSRRLENYYQEQGYFFADVTAYCTVEPPIAGAQSNADNGQFLCSSLGSGDLSDRKVKVNYSAELRRQLKLTEVRLTGTDQFTVEEISTVLESQEANIFGIIPLFGYGRGYTSEKLLEEDRTTILSLLRELGYRDAEVRVNQGVSPDGENLVITFVVDQGMPTVISDVRILGNSVFSDAELKRQLPHLIGKNFSRAKIRNGQRKLTEFYAEAGYFDSIVEYSVDEKPNDPVTGERLVDVVFEIKHKPDPLTLNAATSSDSISLISGEGEKVFVRRVLITGNERTQTAAIQKALTIEPNNLLRAADIYSSEQNLYSSDVFSRVGIKREPVGSPQSDQRLADVIVNVEEQAPRLLSYGGGYSTDLKASGFVDIRHFNLFGRLWQGGARLRVSQRQQLAQIDFVNPRFVRDGEKRFAPLTITAQYQRDSTVTRFFRSAFDRGTFGIVQRLDADGNPIDEFGANVDSPTLHRLTFTAETNRTLSRSKRSILFLRYRYEDVRLYNIQSLLIKELLIPDSRIRVSGFGATYVRDTRENCSVRYTILDIIARGEVGSPCRYSASDPTKGSYITAEINTSLPALGANIGFAKFQASTNVYYTPSRFFKKTTFAARAIIGLGQVFASRNRFSSSSVPDLEGILPISERFFAGGPNTLRGFDFESAGPRAVIVPTGTFRDRNGDIVSLPPFTIPFGGNALAVVNLEARIPFTKSIKIVPFYDGGNVFRRIGDVFNPPDVPPNDVARQNLRALWSHTVGLGIRLKTPVGGELGVDYGYLLNPPSFLIPQGNGVNAIYRPSPGKFHFRFSQAF